MMSIVCLMWKFERLMQLHKHQETLWVIGIAPAFSRKMQIWKSRMRKTERKCRARLHSLAALGRDCSQQGCSWGAARVWRQVGQGHVNPAHACASERDHTSPGFKHIWVAVKSPSRGGLASTPHLGLRAVFCRSHIRAFADTVLIACRRAGQTQPNLAWIRSRS